MSGPAQKMKCLLSWSGGKDSCLALHETMKDKRIEVVSLLTTIARAYDRVSIHGVRRVLLEQQAQALGLPLETVLISSRSSNEEYEARMKAILQKHIKLGVSGVVFGDLFLEDLRKYRESRLKKLGLKGIFPLWKRDTAKVARDFIKLGFKAVVTCVDKKSLGGEFAGRDYDERFLDDLPTGVDPCGENGEFHSFVYDGPLFAQKIALKKGRCVLKRKRFYFCDFAPVGSGGRKK
jgi:uncharacterized protein (TIGR00290 family)